MEDIKIIDRLLEVTENDIVPLTQAGVRVGNIKYLGPQ